MKYKSRTTGELIPVIVFEFRNWNDLLMNKDEYADYGGYNGVIKAYCVPVGELKKVHHIAINPKDLPTGEWYP